MNLKKGGLKDFLPGLAGRDIRWPSLKYQHVAGSGWPSLSCRPLGWQEEVTPSGRYVGKPFAVNNDRLYAEL